MKKINKNYYVLILSLFIILTFAPGIFANENINFLTLKNNEVNLRQGPSFKYPIKLIYKKKYLPVIILDKSETWRKISDFENNSGWIHVSQLSKKKSAINIKNNSIIYKKPTIFSKPIAKLENGRLMIIKKCKIKWCKITSGKYSGWIEKKYLPVEILDTSETWRKIKDLENNTGWIHISQLSKKKSAINIKNNSILYKKPSIYSKPIARIETGKLLVIKKCKLKWCKIESEEFTGWITKNFLWGMIN